MTYTFIPKEKYARAFGNNMRISTKSAAILCRVIRKKPLTRAKRLLQDLAAERRSLDGKHYTKTAREMAALLESCEKNADNLDLDKGRLIVHASAHKGTNMRRRRRKAKYGSQMKTTNLEIMLIERGREDRLADVKIVRSKEDLEKVVKEVAEKVAAKEKTEKKEEQKIEVMEGAKSE
jgi:ribosomal protein L22